MTPEEKKYAQDKRRGKGKNLSLWLSPNQQAELATRTQLAGAGNACAFIKSRIFDEEIIFIQPSIVRRADPELIRQLSWIGNNVNQISRAINQSKQIGSIETVGIFAALSLIAEELEIIGATAL